MRTNKTVHSIFSILFIDFVCKTFGTIYFNEFLHQCNLPKQNKFLHGWDNFARVGIKFTNKHIFQDFHELRKKYENFLKTSSPLRIVFLFHSSPGISIFVHGGGEVREQR